MQAGPLDLQLFYSKKPGPKFKVHERWLSQEAAIQSLGLLAVIADYDVVLHTVKTLFSDGLDQVLSQELKRSPDLQRAWGKRHEICRNMEQRLLNFLRMDKIRVETTSPGSLEVLWPSVQGWPDDTPITVQVHSTDHHHCAELKEHLLADDGQFFRGHFHMK